jgi:hypothetical protein
MNEIFNYSPTDKATVAEFLMAADKTGDYMQFYKILLGPITKQFGAVYLQHIEHLLRVYTCHATLLAIPKDMISSLNGINNNEHIAVLPQTGYRQYPNGLSICPGGIEQAIVTAEKYGKSYDYEQNFADLAETGFLVPKPNTQTSRMSKAGLN